MPEGSTSHIQSDRPGTVNLSSMTSRSVPRAPLTSGEAILVPALDPMRWAGLQAPALPPVGSGFRFPGHDLGELTLLARSELLQAAGEWTGRYRSLPGSTARAPLAAGDLAAVIRERPFFLAGHQPSLFHPGVWWKNFVLDRLARRSGAIAINLIVDHDVEELPGILLPALGANGTAHWQSILYDRDRTRIPFEWKPLRDRGLFLDFPQRLSGAVRPWVRNPLVERLWPLVLDVLEDGQPTGHALAIGRHQLEAQSGLDTLEVPVSRLCRTRSFAAFVAAIVVDHRRFAELYNRELELFRQRERVLSPNRPVPPLQISETATELPFWFHDAGDPQRHRLIVERRPEGFWLGAANRQGGRCLGESRLVEDLQEWCQSEPALRPRALMTTMFARLLLSDLFLHGIGGAVYDQLTDAIAAGFFGQQLPAFLTATGTWRWIDWNPRLSQTRLDELGQKVHASRYHPERLLPPDRRAENPWVRQKQALIPQMARTGDRRTRHAEMLELNRKLQEQLGDLPGQLRQEWEATRAEQDRCRVIGSREISFAAHPDGLPERLLQKAQELVDWPT